MLVTMVSETRGDRGLIEQFARTRDALCVADDAVFEIVPTNEILRGRARIAAFLRSLSYERFAEARFETRVVGLDERNGVGVIEWSFSGQQIGPAFGVAASGRQISLVLALVCQIGTEGITRSRLFFDGASLHQQLRSQGGDPWTA